MTPSKSIYSGESENIIETISKLISRHNVLCAIEDAFAKNKTASEYFQIAKNEVLESGNQSYGSMFAIAIESMSEFIEDHEDEEVTDIDKLQYRIYNLESENRKLKAKLDEIIKVANS